MRNLDETQPTRPQSDGDTPKDEDRPSNIEQIEIQEIDRQEEEQEESPLDLAEKKPHRRVGRLIALGLVTVLILGGLGGLGGYLKALDIRMENQEAIIGTEVADQFLLGLINFERGEYEVARQRFEYILSIDPNNTAAAEKLTEVLLRMGAEDSLPTPKPTSTIGLTPTPDTRQLEEIYNLILAMRDQQNWDTMLENLDALRSRDIDYKAVDLDGLYFIAYRNRGLQRIQIQGNLEGGIFDLNRAELYGPLDIEARNYRDWAGKYITGVSFWGIDWDEVLNYLSPLAISAPYLSDSSNFTVQDRVATAQVEVNLKLIETARFRYTQRKWCEAYDMYSEASQFIQLSDDDRVRLQDAENKCFGIEPTLPPGEPTPTPGS
jgi:tetratricopeptide (TPR) repeat protein